MIGKQRLWVVEETEKKIEIWQVIEIEKVLCCKNKPNF